MSVFGLTVEQWAIGVIALIVFWVLLSKFGGRIGGVLIVLALVLAGAWSLIHSFTAFSGQTLIATVKASSVSNVSHEMTVDLTTYSSDGTPATETYEVGGDLWMLQSETVEYQSWVLALGIHSGYHLSRLSGEYSDSELGSRPVSLGSWSWFNSLENNVGLFFPVVKSAYGSAVIDPPGTYSVFVDSAGDLSATRA